MTKYLQSRPGSIEEITKQLMDDYQAFFKSELEKADKSIPSMTDSEKKAFFDKVAKDYNIQKEEVKPGSFKDKIMKKIGQPIKDYNKKKEDVEKAPSGHEMRPGKLLLEPKKDDLKKQPKIQQEATSSIIGQDLEKPVEDEAVDKDHMLVVNPKNKKPGNDGVKKIHKKDWPEHQKQGYIQAEAVVNPYAVGMAAAEKSTGDKPPLKKSTITKAHDIAKKIMKKEDIQADKQNASQKAKSGEKEIINKLKEEEVKINEAGMKEIDTDKKEMERLHTRLTQLRDAEKAAAGGDTTNLEKQINQTRLALLDLQKKNLENKEKKEDIQADKQNASQKAKSGEKEIINKLKEEKKVDVKKNKKGEKDVNVQIEVESKKPNYKSYKKSLKKEQDEPKKGKTMTGKKMTPIDTEPKISHN